MTTPPTGAPEELFLVPCVELEDTQFRSVEAALEGCARSDCGDNKKHCGYPDVLRYTLSGSVEREDRR